MTRSHAHDSNAQPPQQPTQPRHSRHAEQSARSEHLAQSVQSQNSQQSQRISRLDTDSRAHATSNHAPASTHTAAAHHALPNNAYVRALHVSSRRHWIVAILGALAVVALLVGLLAGTAFGREWMRTTFGFGTLTATDSQSQTDTTKSDAAANATDNAQSAASSESEENTSSTATPSVDAAAQRAHEIVEHMTLDERVGQLVMVPLNAGDAASSVQDVVANRHVGSVLLLGNWTNGVSGVRASTDAVQTYASNGAPKLIVAADQEGGLVQHLQGAGFSAMPSAFAQGQLSTSTLQSDAAIWGRELADAGVNVDLAPSLDTVTVARSQNAPIGALDRDFGLDAAGNAAHGIAFINGMRKAHVGSAVKHFPGLGSVTGNTDFTAYGILDTTTTRGSQELSAFTTAIQQAHPAMVMMALATYEQLDANEPAAFSSTIIDGLLRNDIGYDGVVISDSMSAAAVANYATDQLGVKFIHAGGDLVCIGDASYVTPILDGLVAQAHADSAFANRVTQSAERIVKLKIELGLAS